MEEINIPVIQQKLDRFIQHEVYIHLETTKGAYAAHRNHTPNVGAFIRNAKVTVQQAKITGDTPYRVGIKIDLGWIYTEGLTLYDHEEEEGLFLYGLDEKGKLAVALQISTQPFKEDLS